jgi:hypothetical protein
MRSAPAVDTYTLHMYPAVAVAHSSATMRQGAPREVGSRSMARLQTLFLMIVSDEPSTP